MPSYRVIPERGGSFWATRARIEKILKRHGRTVRWAGAVLITDCVSATIVIMGGVDLSKRNTSATEGKKSL